MKCIILAAGYATRLYPLTENFPKPLLEVGGKSILDRLIDDIGGLCDGFVVVSNHKFYDVFSRWAAAKGGPISILDDGTCTNEGRLGAVCDIEFAVNALQIEDDVLVIAGDNLLDFSLRLFVEYARNHRASCVMRYFEPDESRLSRSGVISISPSDRIEFMEEKPSVPKSNWCCPPFYFYLRSDISLIGEAIASGCGTDAPGSFVAWLSARVPVFAMKMPGRRYDIGTMESYKSVCEFFSGKRW